MSESPAIIKTFRCSLCGKGADHADDAQRCFDRCAAERAAEILREPDETVLYALRQEFKRELEPILRRLYPSLDEITYLEVLKRKEFLTSKEVARLYGIPHATLDTLRSRGGGPAYHQVHKGGTVLYRHEDVREYVTRARVRG